MHSICICWNMVQWESTFFFDVAVGPEKPMIEGPAFAETGHNASFQCSAMSVPPSQFSWWFNGSKVSNTSMFKTDLLSLNMSGEYTCMAYNYITKKNSTNSKMLTVVGKKTRWVCLLPCDWMTNWMLIGFCCVFFPQSQ